MSGATDHLWGIILAGGEGRRLQPFIRSYLGSERPKQYCALVGQAGTLLSLFVRLTPKLFIALHRICSSLGLPQQADALEKVYSDLPAINFSQEILTRSSHRLGVLRVKGIYWNDWGNPEQVRHDISRFGAWRGA